MADIVKQRTIQEYVPGKQITLCHIIAKPDADVFRKLGLNDEAGQSVGILTITPSEASIIAADTCAKAARIKIGFLDRFSGSVVITGELNGVENALKAVLSRFAQLKFDEAEMTRS